MSCVWTHCAVAPPIPANTSIIPKPPYNWEEVPKDTGVDYICDNGMRFKGFWCLLKAIYVDALCHGDTHPGQLHEFSLILTKIITVLTRKALSLSDLNPPQDDFTQTHVTATCHDQNRWTEPSHWDTCVETKVCPAPPGESSFR